MSQQRRQYVKYTFYAANAAWRSLGPSERDRQKGELIDVLEHHAEHMMVRTYSTVGMRGDCDFLLWSVSERLEDIQELHAAVAGSAMGACLTIAHSFLAMTKRSIYVDNHRHEGQEGTRLRIRPAGKRYFFVYPFWKTVDWYLLPMTDRQQMMDEHIRIGHKYPEVRINTTYSFGLDDQEFVVGFESNSPADFLDLVMELRESQARKYTLRDTPIFTCIAGTPAEVLDMIASPERAAVGV
jgi:chlorite dismutase